VRLADLPHAHTCPEPQAAAVQYASRAVVEVGERVAVYDLGAGTFDVCVLEKTEGGFQVLGVPDGIEQLGGIDFDQAVFRRVYDLVSAEVTGLDAQDPRVRSALARLRRDCVDAKEALSTETETVVPVSFRGMSTEIPLTRTELESLIAPALEDTVTATRRALASARLGVDELSSVVLIGGSSRIPFVSQLLQAELGVTVARDTHPKHDVVLGALRQLIASDPVPVPVAPPAPPAGATPQVPAGTPPAAPETVPPTAPSAATPERPVPGPEVRSPPGTVQEPTADAAQRATRRMAGSSAAPHRRPWELPPGHGRLRGGLLAGVAVLVFLALTIAARADTTWPRPNPPGVRGLEVAGQPVEVGSIDWEVSDRFRIQLDNGAGTSVNTRVWVAGIRRPSSTVLLNRRDAANVNTPALVVWSKAPTRLHLDKGSQWGVDVLLVPKQAWYRRIAGLAPIALGLFTFAYAEQVLRTARRRRRARAVDLVAMGLLGLLAAAAVLGAFWGIAAHVPSTAAVISVALLMVVAGAALAPVAAARPIAPWVTPSRSR
jgi:Hsp70 protein